MTISLKKQRDGKNWRPCWYGEYRDSNGKRRVVNLNVRWRGIPPQSNSLRDAGDAEFERSRLKAETELARYRDEAKSKGRAENLTERLIQSKTGAAVQYVRLEELAEKWRNLGRDTEPSERHLKICDTRFRRFIDFIKQRNPSAEYLYQVTKEDAGAFKRACAKELAPSTAKQTLRLMKQAFDYFLPAGMANPFSSFAGKRGNGQSGAVHRKPFTPEELRQLLETARNDEFMFPLITCAAMTGMRRGDVCNLRWEDVDMAEGMLNVKTGKTDQSVEIPIFGPLRDVLEKAGGKRKGRVWPQAAEMLEKNPDGLTYRFKKIVARAFSEDQTADMPKTVPAADIQEDAIKAIREHYSEGARRDRMIDILKRYAAGAGIRTIEKETGVAKSTVSGDLHTVETLIGKKFMRGNMKCANTQADIARLTRVERDQGQRAASIWDWHALRTTWVTLALASGVPETTVRIVTGHATCELVLKHYFKPNRDQLRASLAGALPEVLTGGKAKEKAPADELVELAEKVRADTATQEDKERLRLLSARI